MRRLSLSEWAQVGEVVGMVAVVVSLLLVVYSLNQNTAALRGEHENLVFESHSSLMKLFVADESLAAMRVKLRGENPQLSAIEQERWDAYVLTRLDIWVMAYHRYNQGLLTEEQWLPWDDYFTVVFSTGPERLSRERWEQWAFGYEPAFWAHVSERLFGE